MVSDTHLKKYLNVYWLNPKEEYLQMTTAEIKKYGKKKRKNNYTYTVSQTNY